MHEKKFDIQERLINFSVAIIKFIDMLPQSRTSWHLGGQLLRSGTSPTLNYGEAQAAESKNDFIHKMKICLKELRETKNGLIILQRLKLYKSEEQIALLINECGQLIAIFTTSIGTIMKGNK